jgi:hypothetical protein
MTRRAASATLPLFGPDGAPAYVPPAPTSGTRLACALVEEMGRHVRVPPPGMAFCGLFEQGGVVGNVEIVRARLRAWEAAREPRERGPAYVCANGCGARMPRGGMRCQGGCRKRA